MDRPGHRRRRLAVAAATIVLTAFAAFVVTRRGDAAEAHRRVECAHHLRTLGALIIQRSITGRRTTGAAWSASRPVPVLVADGRVPLRDSDLLRCPDDSSLAAVSYAARDLSAHPLEDGVGGQVLAACTHHTGGVQVMFSDGSVRFLTTADLGLPENAPITVGPDTAAPLLRVFPANR